jgi:hypothetical protein
VIKANTDYDKGTENSARKKLGLGDLEDTNLVYKRPAPIPEENNRIKSDANTWTKELKDLLMTYFNLKRELKHHEFNVGTVDETHLLLLRVVFWYRENCQQILIMNIDKRYMSRTASTMSDLAQEGQLRSLWACLLHIQKNCYCSVQLSQTWLSRYVRRVFLVTL